MLHAAVLLWVAGAGHLLHGDVDLHAMAWLLVGSIPGVLIGSHLSVRVPERSLRIAFGFVLILSGIKLVGVPAATLIIEIAVGLGALALCTWLALRAPPAARCPLTTRRRIARAWPGSCRRRSSSPCSRRQRLRSRSRRGRSSSSRRSRHEGRPGLLAGQCDPAASRSPTSQFRLRTRERLEVWIEDANGRRVCGPALESQRAERREVRPRLGRVLPERRDLPRRRLPAGREARALAPHARPAEPDPSRHEAARDHRAQGAARDHLARRRRPQRRLQRCRTTSPNRRTGS